jgi:hypothetical protein
VRRIQTEIGVIGSYVRNSAQIIRVERLHASMTDTIDLSLRVPATAADLYTTAFSLTFVGLLTGLVLVGTGIEATSGSLATLGALALGTAALAAKIRSLTA